MTGGAPTFGGITRLSDLIGGDPRWDVNIEGGTLNQIAINSYNMPDGGSIQDGDKMPIVRNDLGYLVDAGGSGQTTNIFYPEDFGAKADAVGAHDGVYDGTWFSSATYSFQPDDIGKSFWQDGNQRIISEVGTGANEGKIKTSPANYGTTGILWLMSSDDTAAIQAACDAARDVQGPDIDELSAGGTDQMIPAGGVVYLTPGKRYGVFNSQESWNDGKISCVTIYRRMYFGGSVPEASNETGLVMLPGSYGHIVSNISSSAHTDFFYLANLSLWGYKEWQTSNALDGFHLEIPYDNFDKVDAFNRVDNVFVLKAKRHGMYFSGRGELVVNRVNSNNNGQNGILMNSQYDWTMTSSNAGSNGNAGIVVYQGGGILIGCKSYYNGSDGAADKKLCCNWLVDGDQFRGGFSYFVNCQGQESRGSSWVITTGMNTFVNCQALDPNRTGLNSGTLPSVLAGVHLSGDGARLNTFDDFIVSPSVAVYQNPNWNADTYAVYIDDVDGDGAGPQLNRGNIITYLETINSGGGVQVGIQYSGTGSELGGGGTTNGVNPNLYVNGVPLAGTPITPASNDLVEIIDVSDTTGDERGTKKFVEVSAIGGGISIGSTISGATDNRILFVGASSTLDDDAGLTYDASNGILGVTGTSLQKAAFFDPSRIYLSEATGNGAARIELKPVDALASDRTQRLPDMDGTLSIGVGTKTVSSLGSASPAGRVGFVSDANATTFNSIVAGGGSNFVPVFSDGTNWRIG